MDFSKICVKYKNRNVLRFLITVTILFQVLPVKPQVYNREYTSSKNLQPNLKKLDSVLKKALGYETGMYWNTLWARYYASDDFKGLRSMYDPNIVRYSLYSKEYPLVYVNDLPLLFYEIGKIRFTKIHSVNFYDSIDLVGKKNYPVLEYGVLDIKANMEENISSELNFQKNLMEKYKSKYRYDVSSVGLHSFLDSILVATIGLTRNQCYNLLIHRYFTESSCANCKPLLYSNQLVHGQLPPAPIVLKDTAYYIYVNKAPMEFFDDSNLKFNSQKSIKIKGVKTSIEKPGNTDLLIPTIARIDILVE